MDADIGNKEDAVCLKVNRDKVDTDKQEKTCSSPSTSHSKETSEEKKEAMAAPQITELKETNEETDELLEKIEEVVKDNVTTLKVGEEDISQASEQDFLRKIDEEMKDSDSDILVDCQKAYTPKKDSKLDKEKDKNDGMSALDAVIVNKKLFIIEDGYPTNNEINKSISSNSKNSIEMNNLNSLPKDKSVQSDLEVDETRLGGSVKNDSKKPGIENPSPSTAISLTNEKTELQTVPKHDVGLTNSVQNNANIVEAPNKGIVSTTKVEEPMIIDSSESSNDNKMDIDEKIEMEVDENPVCRDEEMKTVENKISNKFVETKNIIEIQNEISSSNKLLQETVQRLNENSTIKVLPVAVNVNVVLNTANAGDVVGKEKVTKTTEQINKVSEIKHQDENKDGAKELDKAEISKETISTDDPTAQKKEQKKIDEVTVKVQKETPVNENVILDDVIDLTTKETKVCNEITDKILEENKTSDLINTSEVVTEDNKIVENKLLAKLKGENNARSLTNSPLPQTTNVFNSTPIAKQFEISSENVSKISDALEHSRNEQNICNTEIRESSKSQTNEEVTPATKSTPTTTTTESDSCYTLDQTDHQSSDGISKYINLIKNGIDSTTTDDGSGKVIESQKLSTVYNRLDSSVPVAGTSSMVQKMSDDHDTYEISVWSDKNDALKYLTIEKLGASHKAATAIDKVTVGADSSSLGQASSSGSVSSIPQFSLPLQKFLTVMSSSGSVSENSEKTIDDKFKTIKTKHQVKGISELCAFMIQHFKQIQMNLKLEVKAEDSVEENTSGDGGKKRKRVITASPRSKSRSSKRQSQSPAISDSSSPVSKEGRSSKMSCESPLSVGKSGSDGRTRAITPSGTRKSETRSRKRSISKVISDDDADIDGRPKAKQARKSQAPSSSSQVKTENNTSTAATDKQIQTQNDQQCVLARWVDKKYYAGRILETKPGNKFVVRFEDGASKVLQRDLIVFGENGILPLKDHKIYALVDDDYECGTVISIDKINNKILYTVKAETNTVKVTATDIYLQDDQAKIIQNLQNNSSMVLGSNTGNGSQDSTLLLDPSSATTRNTRQKRASAGSPLTAVSPEPGTSGGGNTTGKKGSKRQKRSSELRISESSDITDISTKSSRSNDDIENEAIEGLQEEYQRTIQEAEHQKLMFIFEYKSINPNFNVEKMLGHLPTMKSLFKNKFFLLTCTAGLKPHLCSDADTESQVSQPTRNMQFSKIPFVRPSLEKQILTGGGKIYKNFDDIPKSRYRQCVLIAPRPCKTAKYIQCLAANIQAVSHEWIIDSCNKNTLAKKNAYHLPAGWSILLDRFIQWTKGKNEDQRQSNQPFADTYILIAGAQENFVTFWSKVCKLAGGTVRIIKTIDDITSSTTGYMITDSDFPENIKRKAEHFGIPIVSSVWIVQSLIMGKICLPDSHIKLSCTYTEDDDLL